MNKYGPCIKEDFKAIHRKILRLMKIAAAGDPEKLVAFPAFSKILEEALTCADEFRVYMFNTDFKTLMILPTVKNIDVEKIVSIIFEYSSLIDSECGGGIKALARSLRSVTEWMTTDDSLDKDTFFIWFFTGHRLVGSYEIDPTAACLIALCSAPLNSYDHTRDKEILDGVTREVLSELYSEDMFEKNV